MQYVMLGDVYIWCKDGCQPTQDKENEVFKKKTQYDGSAFTSAMALAMAPLASLCA